MKIYGLLCTLLFCNSICAETLEDISRFAENICDKVETKGTMESSELKASIKGEISPKLLSKILGAKVSADGSYTVNGKTYNGLPFESLPEQLTSARQCRKEIASMLMEERRNITKNSHTKPKYAIQNTGFHSMLMKEANFNAYIDFFNKNPLHIKILMDGTKISLLSEKVEKTSSAPVTWYQVKVISGLDTGLKGWIPQRSVVSL